MYEYKYIYYSEVDKCWYVTDRYYKNAPKLGCIVRDLHRAMNTKRRVR